MLKRNTSLAFISLIVLGSLGAWLTGMFEAEKKAEDITGGSLLLGVLGFFIFLGAIVGILLLIRQHMPSMTRSEMLAWATIRSGGKQAYLRGAFVKGLLFGVIGISGPLIRGYLNAKSIGETMSDLWIYIALFSVVVGGMLYAAIRTWNANEQEYDDLNQSTTGQNASIESKSQ